MDSLGIAASLCGDLGIADKINKKLYNNDKRRVVTPGKSVEAMILYPKGIILNKHNIGNQAVMYHFNFIFNGNEYKWVRPIKQSALSNKSIF